MAKKRIRKNLWSQSFQRSLGAITRATLRAGTQAVLKAARPVIAKVARKVVRKAVRKVVRKAVRQAVPTVVRKAVRKSTAPRRTTTASPGEWIAGLALGPAGARRYHLYRPAGVRATERLPLLLMLHGCGQDAEQFARVTRMNRLAARERFLLLYVEQDRLANAQGCWNWYDTRSGRAQAEVALLLGAVDQVCRLYPIDVARVAVAGLSAGASTAAQLALALPARFAAVVMHSGVASGMASSSASALAAMRGRRAATPLAPAVLPPLLVIQGHLDGVVAAKNGLAAAELWAGASDAKAAPPRRVQRGQRYPMSVTDFKLKGGTLATLCEIDRLGHAWSGGAAGQPYSDPKGPDASRLLWAFVSRQWRGAEVTTKGRTAASRTPGS